MKKFLAVVLALALVVALGASAFADIKVAFSQIGQESDWRTARLKLMKAGSSSMTMLSRSRRTRSRPSVTSSPRVLTTSSSPALFLPAGMKSLQK